jgi:Mg2+ and Co2+ transporter CorA
VCAVAWTDLLDPRSEALDAAAPVPLPPAVRQLLTRPSSGDPEPRPRLVGIGTFVVGVFLVPVLERDEIYYRELDVILAADGVLTVRKTPAGGSPLDLAGTRSSVKDDDPPGMIAFRIADQVAEAYLDLIDGLDDSIDELEDHVDEWPAARIRRLISDQRHSLLHIRRTLSPTRDAVRQVVDNRVEIEGGELFDRHAEVAFGTTYDKLLRASEGLDFARDLLAGVRDYSLAKIANDQNETTKRLTAFATLLLVPTFIVGLYGQNFRDIPELRWRLGYAWAWGLIVVTTLLQLVYYRRKRWL